MNDSNSDFDTDEPFKRDADGKGEEDQGDSLSDDSLSDESLSDESLSGEIVRDEMGSGKVDLSDDSVVPDFETDYPDEDDGTGKSSSVATLPPLGSNRRTRGFAGGDPSDPRNWPNIDGYIIEAYLGGGGFGTVFRAHSTKLDATVAIKVLKPEVLHRPDAVKRFSQEVTTAARNRHLHVVQVLDTGVIETASHERCQYMVTEFLAGGDFLSWLGEHPRTSRSDDNLRLAIEKLVQICRGLESLHQAGIVHRDIKPENVLLDQDGSPKLADFGLAGIFDEKLAEARSGKIQLPLPDDMENSLASRLTVTGDVFGTLGYMAPELFMGMQNASPASDQYSIGVILYVILCDLRPFQAKRRDPEERVRIQQAIDNLDRQLPPPSIEPPSSKSNFRDRGLQFICMKCLRGAPELRYADVAALRSDLEAWLNGQTVGEGLLTRIWNEKIYLPVKNRPFRYLASVAAILIVVALGFIAKNRLEYEAELLGTNNELTETNRKLEAAEVDLKSEKENLQRQLLQSYKVAGQQAATAGNYGDTALAYAAAWQVIDTMPNHTQSEKETLQISHAFGRSLSPSLVAHRTLTPGNLSFQVSRDGQHVFVLDNMHVKSLKLSNLLSLIDDYRIRGPVKLIQVSRDCKKLFGFGTTFEDIPICYIWNVTDFDIVRDFELDFVVNDAAFCFQDAILAICGKKKIDGIERGVLEIRDIGDLEVIARHFFDIPAVRLASDADSKRVACILSGNESKLCMFKGSEIAKSWEIDIPGSSYCSLSFSPDATRLAAVTNNGTAILVQCSADTDQQKPVLLDLTRSKEKSPSFDSFENPLGFLRFSDNGTMLATACGGKSVNLWDSMTGQSLGDPLMHPDIVTDVDIHPTRPELVTSCLDEFSRVWSIPSGDGLVANMRHTGAILSAKFTPSGNAILTAGEDGLLRKWTYQLPQPMTFGNNETPIQVATNTDASVVVLQSDQNVFRAWNLADGEAAGPEFKIEHPVHQMVISNDGNIVALAGLKKDDKGTISLVNPLTGALNGDAIIVRNLILAMRFSPDQKWLAFIASTSMGHTLHLLDLETRAVREISLLNPDRIAWNPAEPTQLLVGVRAGTVHEVPVPDLAPKLLPLSGDSQVFRDLQFSLGGKYVATTTGNGIKIWNVADWSQMGSPLTHGGSEPNGLAFSPVNERQVVSYGNDGAAITWQWDQETEDWTQRGLVSHRSPVNSVEFSADGYTFATASDDATVRMWTYGTSEPFGVPFLHHTESNGLSGAQLVRFIKDSNDLLTFASNYKGLSSVLPMESMEKHLFADQRASESTLRPLANRSVMQLWRWTVAEASADSEEAMQQAQIKERRKIDSSGRIVRLNRTDTRKLLESMADRGKETTGLLIELASLALAEERWEDVVRHLEPVLISEANQGELWYNYGLAKRGIGNKDEAILAFGRAIDNGYRTSQIYLSRGKLLVELGKFEEALADLQIAFNTALIPNEAAFNLGYCQASLGNFDAANEAYLSGIEAAIKFGLAFEPKNLYELSLIQLALAPEKADSTILKNSLEMATGARDSSVCFFLAFGASICGGDEVDWDSVVELARTAYELLPEITNTKLCIAYALNRSGRHNEANSLLEDAIVDLEANEQEQPVNPLPLFFHAMTLHSLGKGNDALKALQRGEKLLEEWNAKTDVEFLLNRYGWTQRLAFKRLRSEARELLGLPASG